MRALLIVVVAVAAGCDRDVAAPVAPPRPPPHVETAAAQRALHDCRDGCEQNAIVTQASDATLQACRAGCDARFGAAAAPAHEVPSRITRSPPVHAPPAVRPR
ncbi:MAG TPA: hypothetical protein VF997_06140 [Polyangia bacterium]